MIGDRGKREEEEGEGKRTDVPRAELSGRDAACAILPRYGPNERACQDDAQGKVFLFFSFWGFICASVCIVRPCLVK